MTEQPYYQDDHVTLWHADCLERTDLWQTADVLVTDPPYGIRWPGLTTKLKSRAGEVTWTNGNDTPIAGDETLESRDRVLALWGDRPGIVFGSWRKPRPAHTTQRIIWWKRGQAPGPTHAAVVAQDEEIYLLGHGWPRRDSPERTVIPTDEPRSRAVIEIGHPTPKPVGLMERLISLTPPGTIADPFAGSGATLIAARNLGRHAIGIELEERYCEITAKRLAQQPLDLWGR